MLSRVGEPVQGYPWINGLFFLSQPFKDVVHLRPLSDNPDESEEQSIDGEDVGNDANGVDNADVVDEDAVADEEMDQTPGLPHVQPIHICLQ